MQSLPTRGAEIVIVTLNHHFLKTPVWPREEALKDLSI